MKKLIAILLVNFLTAVRVIGVFCLLPIYLEYGGIAAAELSIVCYFTDCLDGIIARKSHVSTFFGSVFDGTADKLFSVANLLVLFTITKFAIFPILCEFTIVLIQFIKYRKNINVKSSMMGKIKTWVISLTVIVLYLVSDIQSISFLSSSFIDKIVSMNQYHLYIVLFTPLYIFEVLTVISYLFIKEKDIDTSKVKLNDLDIKLKARTSFKNTWDNFCTFWLNNEFYEAYKDKAGLREIRKYLKENR